MRLMAEVLRRYPRQSVVMLLALAVLWWSMRRHLKVNEENERRADADAAASRHEHDR